MLCVAIKYQIVCNYFTTGRHTFGMQSVQNKLNFVAVEY